MSAARVKSQSLSVRGKIVVRVVDDVVNTNRAHHVHVLVLQTAVTSAPKGSCNLHRGYESVIEQMVTISLDDLRSWLANASYHVRLAVAIAALAPKLRLANVLALTWKEHVAYGEPSNGPGCLSGVRSMAPPCTGFRPTSGWLTQTRSPTWSRPRGSAHPVSLLGVLLGHIHGHLTNSSKDSGR